MPAGTVKFYNEQRGFGFIAVDGSVKDYFFHIRAWPEDLDDPVKGQKVVFEIGPNDRDGREEAKAVKPA